MPYYVYIIRSLKDGTFYKGFTEDYLQRLSDHNAGFSNYTSHKIPWQLVYAEEHPSKRLALIREKKLKHSKREYLEWLITQPSNILKQNNASHGPG
jgi:putative endonuclease